MREIIFRGKDKLGHWLYGGFHLWKTRQPCVWNDELKPEEIKHIIIKNSFADWNMPRTMQPYEVIPETVGQYTGLTDKNGKKIFEGDIVKDEQAQMLGKVVYATAADGFDGMAGFMVDDIDDGLQNYNGFWHLVEVIGNIHDNPELVKERNNG